jgi:hypothetical protein
MNIAAETLTYGRNQYKFVLGAFCANYQNKIIVMFRNIFNKLTIADIDYINISKIFTRAFNEKFYSA